MSNYQYTSDILEDVLFRCSEVTTGQSDFAAQALRYINRAYQSLCDGGSDIDPTVREDWWWLRKAQPGTISLPPAITTGTVTTGVSGDDSLVAFSPSLTINATGWYLKVGTNPTLFRIRGIAGGPNWDLGASYNGTLASGQSFLLFNVEADLASDILRLISPMRLYISTTSDTLGDYKVHGVDLNELEEHYPLSLIIPGTPSLFAPISETRVRFNRYFDGITYTSLKIDYEYLFVPPALANAVNEEPLVPLNRRRLLSDIATAFILADKDDAKAPATFDLARRGLLAMAAENRHRWSGISDRTGRIHPRGIHRRRLWRTESGGVII